jgi:hypothetical protein
VIYCHVQEIGVQSIYLIAAPPYEYLNPFTNISVAGRVFRLEVGLPLYRGSIFYAGGGDFSFPNVRTSMRSTGVSPHLPGPEKCSNFNFQISKCDEKYRCAPVSTGAGKKVQNLIFKF